VDEAFTVVVGTYGAPFWEALARERAIPSAQPQAKVIHVHGEDLASARNEGLARVRTSFVVFLDADDELEPGYIKEMKRGKADFRVPAVRLVYHYGPTTPHVPKVWNHRHACVGDCLKDGNWLVIGTGSRTAAVREAGGFDSRWPVYEDYDLWQRCWINGSTFEQRPKAIYRSYRAKASRNNSMSTKRRNRIHEQIDVANGVRRPDGIY
jgi:glycosyltransferase involved in cell wall biosynthesis